ncbi:MAG: hypothetical protein MK212_15490 [Saprospiraceae bacterium]|nr:hypothetical protein [Saprospiraceae bacterium]
MEINYEQTGSRFSELYITLQSDRLGLRFPIHRSLINRLVDEEVELEVDVRIDDDQIRETIKVHFNELRITPTRTGTNEKVGAESGLGSYSFRKLGEKENYTYLNVEENGWHESIRSYALEDAEILHYEPPITTTNQVVPPVTEPIVESPPVVEPTPVEPEKIEQQESVVEPVPVHTESPIIEQPIEQGDKSPKKKKKWMPFALLGGLGVTLIVVVAWFFLSENQDAGVDKINKAPACAEMSESIDVHIQKYLPPALSNKYTQTARNSIVSCLLTHLPTQNVWLRLHDGADLKVYKLTEYVNNKDIKSLKIGEVETKGNGAVTQIDIHVSERKEDNTPVVPQDDLPSSIADLNAKNLPVRYKTENLPNIGVKPMEFSDIQKEGDVLNFKYTLKYTSDKFADRVGSINLVNETVDLKNLGIGKVSIKDGKLSLRIESGGQSIEILSN